MTDNKPEDKKEVPKVEAPVQQPTQTQAQPVEQESQEQINWKKFRDEREKERQEKQRQIEEANKRALAAEQQAKAIQEAMSAYQSKPANPSVETHQDINIDEIDMPTGSEIKQYTQKVLNAEIQKALQEQQRKIDQQRQEAEAQQLPIKLRETYSDFDNICSQENLDYLEFHHPEIAAAYSSMPDSYKKWDMLYRVTKKYVPNTNSKDDKNKINQNLKSPQSSSAVAPETGQGREPMIPKQKREENWKRMQKIMKGSMIILS